MTPAGERPRIVHVGPDPTGPGGMEAVLGNLLSSSLGSRYQLDVIVTYRTRDPIQRLLVFARALFQLARWCRGGGSRLVHVHTAVRGSIYRKALCVMVAVWAGRPVLLQLHAGAGDIDAFVARLGPFRRGLLTRAVRAADVVVSVSAPGARRIEQLFAARDVIVMPNAAPVVQPVTAPASSADRPSVLFMGGFDNPSKGGAVLVRALPELLRAFPQLEVTLAGTGRPPDELVALARRHPGVHSVGWLEAQAKEERLSRCDVFVMPSISEGMPMALLEAMAYGRAIVASDVGGIPDVVADGTEAILVPPSDPRALTAGLVRVVSDDELRARIASGARERVKEFEAVKVYDRIAAVYDDLLASRQRR
ncbi:MAG: glycosyltransferase family 4 protein [Actinomycetota bacterium]